MADRLNLDKIDAHVNIDFENRVVRSLKYRGVELCVRESAVFSVRLTDKTGKTVDYDSTKATAVKKLKFDGEYERYEFCGFLEDFSVIVLKRDNEQGFDLRFEVKNRTEKIIEHVEVLPIIFKPFEKNGGIGKLLFPYNEGALVEDNDLRSVSHLKYVEPDYPTITACGLFPNMLCSQFVAYLFGEHGLYVGAHDEVRSPKAIDYFAVDDEKNIKLQIRLYSGKGYGEDFAIDYDMVYRFFDGDWHDGADIYKIWLYENLPNGLKKIAENANLPEWYGDFPIILTYPVRGYNDMDEMTPNELFPYVNALPYVDKFAKETGAKIMVLLMHWEGTAPWAPPYVFPPYGGEEEFDKLFDALKERGHLLGVYCSGFSFTEQSNVLPSYDCKEILKDKETFKAFCAGRDGKVVKSTVCTGQRSGYDICVASDKGREILDQAYDPLFAKKLDYIQVLDQNHGGSQLFCFSNEHNHAPCVGAWMTVEMQKLLTEWNKKAGKTLLGCESASAEPFLPNLLFSDNRFELVHFIGKAVPLYAYLYHEFVHNFMGNQVSGLLLNASYLYRMAYSFVAGDMPTIVLNPKGFIQQKWGQRDFSEVPVEKDVLAFIKNMRDFYLENKQFMCYGNMIKPLAYKTNKIVFDCEYGRTYEDCEVLSTAYEFGGQKIQIFANYNLIAKTVEICGKEIEVQPLSIVKIKI